MKYDNIEKIRNMLINDLEKVEMGKLEYEKLMMKAKSAEGIFSSLKLQLAYANMLNEKPYIPYLDDCHVGEATKEPKKITKK